MRILEITEKDRQNIKKFLKERWFSNQISVRGEMIDASTLDGYIIYENEKITGLVTYRIYGKTCEIISLDSVIENKGIGTNLIEKVKEKAINCKCSKVILITTNDNLQALGFYQRRGFSLSKIYKDSMDEVRKIKPEVPLIGENGIPLQDEIEMEIELKADNQKDIVNIVNNQLAIDLNCNIDDFRKDGIIYTKAVINEKQRKCIRKKPYVEMITMGQACIIAIDEEFEEKVKNVLKSKTRNEIERAHIFKQAELHYIPCLDRMIKKDLPKDFEYELIEGKAEIEKLYNIPGFENSIQYGKNYVGPDEIVLYAKDKNKIIAMAGASKDTEMMWQIGCDVKEEYRSKGLATALVSNLANIILEKGKIPYYSTTASNIPSQLVAYKCGFMPYWYSMKEIL